jgi:hypothetical protein
LKNKAPPATFLEKFRVLGDDEENSLSKIRYTGSLMHTNAKAVNREVTGTMNPLWKFTFASGFNETSKFSYLFLNHIHCFIYVTQCDRCSNIVAINLCCTKRQAKKTAAIVIFGFSKPFLIISCKEKRNLWIIKKEKLI